MGAGSCGAARWRPLNRISTQLLPPPVQPWIALESSLTARLCERFGTTIDVSLLDQGGGTIHCDERPLLPGVAARGHVREIALLAGGKPVVVARTIVPPQSVRLLARVRQLGTRPLADLLFARGAPRCVAREFAELRAGSPAFALVARVLPRHADRYWARRTRFAVDGESLLVTEIFLEPIFAPSSR